MKPLSLLPVLVMCLTLWLDLPASGSEHIINGGFDSAAGWTTENTATNNEFTIHDGVVTADDSGDPTDPTSKQVLYQEFENLSGTIEFSFDFRLNSEVSSTLRISLYDGAGAHNTGDVFRSFIGNDTAALSIIVGGRNSKISLSDAGLGSWIRVSGTVDLVAKRTSGSARSVDGSTVYGAWKNRPIQNKTAKSISGFAIYDAAGGKPSGDVSFDNISVRTKS